MLTGIRVRLNRAGDWLLPTLARAVFAGTLLWYFWASALTKLEGTPFSLSLGAYAQIFPRAVEAAAYDLSQLGLIHRAVAFLGTWAEFLLPLAIVLGLLTRLAALGMIGFVAVQTFVDVTGHGAELGAWFDRAQGLADERAFWTLAFLVLVLKGAGPLSLDRLAFGAQPAGFQPRLSAP
ncbi:putative oxidoreductase [Hasllibacter halocynthiae]|uniref:Putative oxidoreductase n=1 Tax=Hasllibacter halocynthiae TaxID=595589 RepID=A0A2T0X6S3_9RHOB|nr:DoxX family protein [Hasllibacter halocynthiae]PRY94652.1 putative oxidoreductase [Hasllibacter halocynthiae]